MIINKKYVWIAVGTLSALVCLYGLSKAVQWHDSHELHGQSPVVVHMRTPIFTTLRELVTNITVVKAQDNTPLSADQQYLCNVFGKDCKTALAIQHAENASGQCDRYHVNDNGSLDWGFMQINTVHLKQVDLKSLLDCKTNIDFAYKLFKQQGNFSAWVTFTSGAYKKYLY